SARKSKSPSTRYSTTCAALRIAWWIASSSARLACGKSAASSGRMIRPVRSPENHCVEKTEITAAHATTGSQRASVAGGLLDKLGHDAVDEVERRLVELGIDEALELLALRGVALAARVPRELRARDPVEKLEHRGIAAGIAGRELAVECQPHGEERAAVLEIFAEPHLSSKSCLSPRCARPAQPARARRWRARSRNT